MTLQEIDEQGWHQVKVVSEGGVYISIFQKGEKYGAYRTYNNEWWELTDKDKEKYGIGM